MTFSGAPVFKSLAQAVALMTLAVPAHANPAAILRIEAELAAPGLAQGIDATAADIIHLERIFDAGPALLVELHPRHASALRDLTTDRVGQRLIIAVCGRVVLEPLLRSALPLASIVITADDPAFLDEIEASLRAPSCDVAALDRDGLPHQAMVG